MIVMLPRDSMTASITAADRLGVERRAGRDLVDHELARLALAEDERPDAPRPAPAAGRWTGRRSRPCCRRTGAPRAPGSRRSRAARRAPAVAQLHASSRPTRRLARSIIGPVRLARACRLSAQATLCRWHASSPRPSTLDGHEVTITQPRQGLLRRCGHHQARPRATTTSPWPTARCSACGTGRWRSSASSTAPPARPSSRSAPRSRSRSSCARSSSRSRRAAPPTRSWSTTPPPWRGS